MIIVEAGVLPRIKQFNMGNSGLSIFPEVKVSRAERKRTSGAEQNRTTERHVVKHQGPGGVRARFRQLPEVGWTSCCA